MKGILAAIVFFVVSVLIGNAQEYRKISKDELQKILKNPSDKLHVINFWATW